MKKTPHFTLALLLLLLTACSTSNASQLAPTLSSDELPIETQLIMGTLQLEGTQQAVTSAQAQELLPMWQVYLSLNSDSGAAQAEIDGLVTQIQETMTSDQMGAISAMGLTQSDVFALMQEHGLGMGQARQSNSTTQNSGGFTPPEGGDMAGGPPSDAGMAAGGPPDSGMGDSGSSVNTEQSQETGASSSPGGGAVTSVALVNTLIQYLEQIANS